MTTQTSASRTGLIGGLLLWFAVLGGFLAWTVHLIVGWATDELACAAGQTSVAGMSLTTVLILAVVVPAAVTVAAFAVAWVAWRRVGRARARLDRAGQVDRQLERAGLMALVGVWANLLFFTIITFGGVALLVFPPCQY